MTLNHLKGKSIIDLLWEDLDDTIEILSERCEARGCGKLAGVHTAQFEVVDGHRLELENYVLEYSIEEYRGRAQGVAYAIALMSNPYLGDVAAVRALAKERYNQRAAGQEVTPLRTRPNLAEGAED